MGTSKLSPDEIDQLDFHGDLTAPEYDAFNVHGNVAQQLPGGTIALCVSKGFAADWYVNAQDTAYTSICPPYPGPGAYNDVGTGPANTIYVGICPPF